jgi:hypothetical protein
MCRWTVATDLPTSVAISEGGTPLPWSGPAAAHEPCGDDRTTSIKRLIASFATHRYYPVIVSPPRNLLSRRTKDDLFL